MKTINNFDEFVHAAILRGDATNNGDYKTGNKLAKKIHAFYEIIKEQNNLSNFARYLNHGNESVRYHAALYYLKYDEEVARAVLEDIAGLHTITGLTAKTTLELWEKGMLTTL
jgi:hypothetical protein